LLPQLKLLDDLVRFCNLLLGGTLSLLGLSLEADHILDLLPVVAFDLGDLSLQGVYDLKVLLLLLHHLIFVLCLIFELVLLFSGKDLVICGALVPSHLLGEEAGLLL
jgi:hypothetical protein